MSSRLWYAQLDVYDTVRRMCLLLSSSTQVLGVERFCILDFYLATPSLLHETTMKFEMRKAFLTLKIPKPKNSFISYPAPPILFHKMEPIQKKALIELGGKGLIEIENFNKGRVKLTSLGRQKFPIAKIATANEIAIANFLIEEFSSIEEIGNKQLRSQTGLRGML